jgi:hypothetical protein
MTENETEIPEIESKEQADEFRERMRDELDDFDEAYELGDKAADEGKWTARTIILDVGGSL